MDEHERSKRKSKSLVVRSIENTDGTRCVDLFRRTDGTFGFEEYRRDPEDPGGWGPAGDFKGRVFTSETQAIKAAENVVSWFSSTGDT